MWCTSVVVCCVVVSRIIDDVLNFVIGSSGEVTYLQPTLDQRQLILPTQDLEIKTSRFYFCHDIHYFY